MALQTAPHPASDFSNASPRKLPSKEINRFEKLVEDIRCILGPSAGLTSDNVDVEDLSNVMARYTSSSKEWAKYALADADMPYTRNLVDEVNGNANLLLLVWTPGRGSPVHDHGNAHCIMKILRGSLTETRYHYPDGDSDKPMQVKSEEVRNENTVAYMADELGLHAMSNWGSEYAISLHLYTPPNVAKRGCNVFNVETGEKRHIDKCGNYSAYGERLATQV